MVVSFLLLCFCCFGSVECVYPLYVDFSLCCRMGNECVFPVCGF